MHSNKNRATNSSLKIVITGGLGDTLLITPFIRHFRKTGDYSKIICAVSTYAYDIFETNPYIDLVIPCYGRDLFLWGLPDRDSDIFMPYMKVEPPEHFVPGMKLMASPLLIRPNQRKRTIVEQVADYHGINIDDESLEIFPTHEDEAWAECFLANIGKGPAVFFNPQSQLAEKDLPRSVSENIVKRLLRDFVVLEAPFERPPFEGTIAFNPPPTIRRCAALFRRLLCVITVDSFPGHLAAATGTPAVVLFGPSSPEVFGHKGNTNIRPTRCHPCADTPRLPACIGHHCMKEFSHNEVHKAVFLAIGNRCPPV